MSFVLGDRVKFNDEYIGLEDNKRTGTVEKIRECHNPNNQITFTAFDVTLDEKLSDEVTYMTALETDINKLEQN